MSHLTEKLEVWWPLSAGLTDLVHGVTLTNVNGTTFAASGGPLGPYATFTRTSTQSLTAADSALYSGGDRDFTIAGWARMASKPSGIMSIFAKCVGESMDFEYAIQWLNTADRIQFLLSSNGTTIAITQGSSNFGAPSIGAWMFIRAWHDSANNQVGLRINSATQNLTTGFTTGVFDGVGDLQIGARNGSFGFDGDLAGWGYWGKVLTNTEHDFMYAAGVGNHPFGGFILPGAKGFPQENEEGDWTGRYSPTKKIFSFAAAPPLAQPGFRVPERRIPISLEDEELFLPPRSFVSHGGLRDVTVTLPLYRRERSFFTPIFARGTEFTLGLYVASPHARYQPDMFSPKVAVSYEFVLGPYAIQEAFLIPKTGQGILMSLYALPTMTAGPQLAGIATQDVTRILPTFEVQPYRFTPLAQTDRVFVLGPHQIRPQAHQQEHIPHFTIIAAGEPRLYLESVDSESETLFGLTEPLKLDPASLVAGSDVRELHLAVVHPQLNTEPVEFTLETPTPLQPGEFFYQTPDHLLTITNETEWSLVIVIDPNPGADSQAIHVTSQPGQITPIIVF